MPERLRPTAPPLPAGLVERWREEGLLGAGQIGWLLERAAERRPGDEALVVVGAGPDGGELRVSRGELRDRADAIAAQLLAGGIGPGDVVFWALPNSVDAVATAAAIWRIGAVSNPVVTIYRQRELAFILGQLRPAATITAADVRGRAMHAEVDEALALAGHEPGLRILSEGEAAGWAPLETAPPPAGLPADAVPAPAEEPCLVLYTSGTTAAPKGVMHSSATLLHEARTMIGEWGLTFRDTFVMASPLTHITGVLQGLMLPCMVGARTLLLDRWDATACVAAIEREGGTYMAGATPFLQGVLDAYAAAGTERPSLRQFCCGGAAVAPELIERAEGFGIAAHRSWGMTEFPSASMARAGDPLERRSRSDGLRGEGIEVEAVDERRRPLPPGEEGELRVRGPERMLGYVDAALNEGVLDAEGWVYTGDVGRVDAAGWVEVSGRVKDIINRGGEKFSAREIEELLARHPDVFEVAVVPVPDERLGEVPAAAVVPAEGRAVDPELLAEYLREAQLSRPKVPTRFEPIEELPRTPAGKVQKHRVVEWFAARD